MCFTLCLHQDHKHVVTAVTMNQFSYYKSEMMITRVRDFLIQKSIMLDSDESGLFVLMNHTHYAQI